MTEPAPMRTPSETAARLYRRVLSFGGSRLAARLCAAAVVEAMVPRGKCRAPARCAKRGFASE